MTTIDNILNNLYEILDINFRRYYNYHQLTLYNKKI